MQQSIDFKLINTTHKFKNVKMHTRKSLNGEKNKDSMKPIIFCTLVSNYTNTNNMIPKAYLEQYWREQSSLHQALIRFAATGTGRLCAAKRVVVTVPLHRKI